MSYVSFAYYYTGGSAMSTLPAVTAFSTPAPNLYDGSIGDTTTTNTVVQTGTGGGSYYFYAMIDLGPSPPSVTQYTAKVYGNAPGSGGIRLYYATSTSSGYTQVGQGIVDPGPYIQTFTPLTARYWVAAFTAGGAFPATIGLSDFRLYDNTGAVILPPGAFVAAVVRNMTSVLIF